jgi:hypothetical protein
MMYQYIFITCDYRTLNFDHKIEMIQFVIQKSYKWIESLAFSMLITTVDNGARGTTVVDTCSYLTEGC